MKTIKNKKTGEVIDIIRIEGSRVYVNSNELENYGYISDWYIPDKEVEENYEIK